MEKRTPGAKTPHCQACGKAVTIEPPVGRREACPFCGADLHCCLNCGFYAPAAYNACREPQAERVLVKDRSNYCDFFSFAGAPPAGGGPAGMPGARDRLAALFRKT
jgi:hypothetical protein